MAGRWGNQVQMQLRGRVGKILKENPDKGYTAQALAALIMKKYKEDCERKRKQSSRQLDDGGLRGQIAREISAKSGKLEQDGFFITRSGRRYIFSCKESYEIIEDFVTEGNKNKGKTSKTKRAKGSSTKREFALYPKTQTFLYRGRRSVYPKRIRENESSNKEGRGGNLWLYPDIVGMEVLSSNWNEEVKSNSLSVGGGYVKLWSLEIKDSIVRSNVRESFFQAVSNSSWANVGYLAAGDIDQKALDELQILSGLHGIGFINLDEDNPLDSEILIPARERAEVDWSTASRIANENPRFKKYIKSVRVFCDSKGDEDSIKSSDWDIPKMQDEDEDEDDES